jgi:hypothetical protein
MTAAVVTAFVAAVAAVITIAFFGVETTVLRIQCTPLARQRAFPLARLPRAIGAVVVVEARMFCAISAFGERRRFRHLVTLSVEEEKTHCSTVQLRLSFSRSTLNTDLRHVDVHQLWLRQEVAAGRILVQWKPTNLMPADGLTKILVRQKHAEFVRQLGLREVGNCLSEIEEQDSPDPASLTQWY